jgi:hypothetical protein
MRIAMEFRMHDGAPHEIAIGSLVIAGWAGRDTAAVAHHIAELQAIGVAPPSRTPLFYRAGARLLTAAPSIQVVGAGTSGEAEAVLVATARGLHVGLGSDHTDREAEAMSVALSKQLCPKPLAPDLWRFEEVADHWDSLTLRSWAVIDGTRQPYQEGTLAELLPPETLIAAAGGVAPGSALFCGTLPVIGGIRPAGRFEMELHDPVSDRRIAHAYDIEPLPAIS